MCNITLQAPTLARKCDISPWLPCGADGGTDGHLTAKISRIHFFHVDHNAPCLAPKILHNHCFQFLLGRTASFQEKSKTMVMQNFAGLTRCVMVYVKMVRGSIRSRVVRECGRDRYKRPCPSAVL